MTEAIMKEIFARLDQIAAKLGTTTEHLWQVLCCQGIVAGSLQVLYVVIFIILAVMFKKFVDAVVVKDSPYCDSDGDLNGAGLFIGAPLTALTLGFLWAACFQLSNLGYLINPEMYALDYVRSIFSIGK